MTIAVDLGRKSNKTNKQGIKYCFYLVHQISSQQSYIDFLIFPISQSAFVKLNVVVNVINF